MRVDISKGGAASELLHSPEFRAQWERLYADCPWASVFQSFAYASTWYEVYQSRFTPLLVDAYDQGGQLSGLFPLAVDANGSLVAAGGRQAEYQVWLARPGEGDAFIEAAVERLTAEFPGRTLTLRYVPPNAPLQWLRNRDIARRCVMRSVRRGLMDLREVDAEAALRKKNNRIKLNRLQRVGPVEYERLTEPEAIDALLEQIVPFCDLRHGAVHDVLPFRGDPLKLPFHRALARVPGLLYVSVLRCGPAVASAQIEIDNRGQLAVGLGAWSPSLTHCSPGRLQLLFLARDVARRGHRSIDLTPGGGYKDLLASRFDEVHTLAVYLGTHRSAASATIEAAKRLTKSALVRFGADPAKLVTRAARLRDVLGSTGADGGWVRALSAFRDRIWDDREVQLFQINTRVWADLPVQTPLRVDCIADLVSYRQGVSGLEARRTFLRRALSLLERGARPYTRVENDDLVVSGWISASPEELDGVSLPGDAGAATAVVHDLSVAARFGVVEWMSILPQLARDAIALPNVTRALVAVPSDRAHLREAVHRINGTYVGSLHARTRGARTRTWSTVQRNTAPGPALDRRPAGALC